MLKLNTDGDVVLSLVPASSCYMDHHNHVIAHSQLTQGQLSEDKKNAANRSVQLAPDANNF